MMVNRRLSKVMKVKEVKEMSNERFIYVCSPRSGKRYRFYYGRIFKSLAKVAVVGAGLFVGAYLFMAAFLNAWDAEYEQRMQRQEEYFQHIEENKPDVPEGMSSDVYNILYGNEGGDK